MCTRISLSFACLCLACLQALYLRLLFELESYITTAEINIYCSITSPLPKIHVSEKKYRGSVCLYMNVEFTEALFTGVIHVPV